MTPNQTLLATGCAAVLLAGRRRAGLGADQLPSSAPLKQFGASVTPAYEGWFNNPDGTHNFLIGYYSRNTQAEVDIPIGPNNHFEPGDPDLGQPTHFLTRRRFGMFVVTVPKEFPKTQKINWTLTVNGVTTSVPFHMHTDYNITPLKSSEESPEPRVQHAAGAAVRRERADVLGPMATSANALERTATVGTPMPLDIWADDDALYSSGGNGPMARRAAAGQRHGLEVSRARARSRWKRRRSSTASKAASRWSRTRGKASTTVTFSEAGDYVLHVTANDYSGNGGGGSGCCWTTVLFKVAVKDGAKTSGQ